MSKQMTFCNAPCDDFECPKNAGGVCHAPNRCLGYEEAGKLMAELEAAKRELAEYSSAVGNAAKLREAVKAVVDVGYPHNFQIEAPHIRGYCYDITRAIEKCFAALSAPRRNCDVGTAEEQAARFDKVCRKYHYCDTDTCMRCCPFTRVRNNNGNCAIAWEQTPYEEGGEK